MFMVFFISFMSSKLTVRWTKDIRLCLLSRKSPLMGVSVSLRNIAVAINSNASHIVFKTNIIADHRAIINHKNRKSPLEPAFNREDLDDDRFWFGRVGSSSGFDVLRMQARTRAIRDIPSPKEWWNFKTATFSASDVLKSSRWSSHNGFEVSKGTSVRSET